MFKSIDELNALKKSELLKLAEQFESEDEDLQLGINGRNTKKEIVEVLAKHMGLEEEVEEEPYVIDETNVDELLAELGLDSVEEIEETLVEETQPIEETPVEEKEPVKAEKKSKRKRVTIPMDAPIPVRTFRGLLIGIYGNILEELDEPENGFRHREIKLEKFNPKAHESFRSTRGNMVLLVPRTGGKYLVAVQNPDNTIEPVIEVTNRGRGFLRCRQLANALHLAFDGKRDEIFVKDEEYEKFASKIELMEVKWDGLGA